MNAIDRHHAQLLASARRAATKEKNCGCHKEKGKPVMLAGRVRGLVQHVPLSPESMMFTIQIVATGDEYGEVLGAGRTEKAALKVAERAVRETLR
jgi:hypothetical protein